MTCLYYPFYSSPLPLTPSHLHKPHTITTALADMVPVRSVPLNNGNLGKFFFQRCPCIYLSFFFFVVFFCFFLFVADTIVYHQKIYIYV